MKTSLDFDPTTWRRFRVACMERGLAASRVLQDLMRAQLDKWAQEKTK